jgi:hypothetical protein
MESCSLEIGLAGLVQLACFHRVAANAQQITDLHGSPSQQSGLIEYKCLIAGQRSLLAFFARPPV